MANRKRLTNSEGEVRELTAEDLADAVPFSSLPEAEQRMLLSLRRRGRPAGSTQAVTKEAVKIRLDADVLAALRASGDGWQTRINSTLRASLVLGGKLKAA